VASANRINADAAIMPPGLLQARKPRNASASACPEPARKRAARFRAALPCFRSRNANWFSPAFPVRASWPFPRLAVTSVPRTAALRSLYEHR
jgi:hypothetical protein